MRHPTCPYQTSAVSEYAHNTGHKPLWNEFEVKFSDHDPYYYTCRAKEAICIRLHPNNINRDSGIEIPYAMQNITYIVLLEFNTEKVGFFTFR